ncbi:hypothetical protein M0804_002032 [Polistes exclamans]|nr:hypothetical protein M0804_002032 [Polistes exclamans]
MSTYTTGGTHGLNEKFNFNHYLNETQTTVIIVIIPKCIIGLNRSGLNLVNLESKRMLEGKTAIYGL